MITFFYETIYKSPWHFHPSLAVILNIAMHPSLVIRRDWKTSFSLWTLSSTKTFFWANNYWVIFKWQTCARLLHMVKPIRPPYNSNSLPSSADSNYIPINGSNGSKLSGKSWIDCWIMLSFPSKYQIVHHLLFLVHQKFQLANTHNFCLNELVLQRRLPSWTYRKLRCQNPKA